MFWSKVRKIKELQEVVRDQERILIARLNSLKVKQEEIDSYQKTLATVEDVKHRELTALVAERDQLFKKVEDLQQEAANDKAEIARLEEQFNSAGREMPPPGPAVN